MLRRLNFTNRIRIRRADVRINLTAPDSGLHFIANLSALPTYDLPRESLVFVEAYRQTNWMRFSFGRIGALESASPRHLSQFDSPEGIRFRVKVTPDGDDKKLLAEADGIPLFLPEQDAVGKDPLLPVKPADLDGEIYCLDFSGAEPLLLVSRRAGPYSDIGRSPAFMALVYPSVLREILMRVIVIERHDDDVSDDVWQSRWLRFTRGLPGMTDIPESGSDEEDKYLWIDSAVAAFSRRLGAHERFAEFWREGA